MNKTIPSATEKCRNGDYPGDPHGHGWFPSMVRPWPQGERWPFRGFRKVRCAYCGAVPDKETAQATLDRCDNGEKDPGRLAHIVMRMFFPREFYP